MARLAEHGVTLPMLIGISPLRSAKSARWMRERLFGTIIPDAMIERLEAAGDPAAEGRRLCLELMQEMASIPGVAGVHLMAPGNEAAIADVIRDAAGIKKPIAASSAACAPLHPRAKRVAGGVGRVSAEDTSPTPSASASLDGRRRSRRFARGR